MTDDYSCVSLRGCRSPARPVHLLPQACGTALSKRVGVLVKSQVFIMIEYGLVSFGLVVVCVAALTYKCKLMYQLQIQDFDP